MRVTTADINRPAALVETNVGDALVLQEGLLEPDVVSYLQLLFADLYGARVRPEQVVRPIRAAKARATA